MLVYVITEELFDDYVGQNFRKLLLEKDKAAEMVLVVNKMADVGNTEANQIIKREDLRKVTTPYSPEDLRTVFIDAESYLDSLTEEDPDIAEELRNRSNYDELVKTLNEFVKDKGISSRLTTVLYKLFEVLQDAIPNYQSSTGDSDVDDIEEHMLRERRIISQTSWQTESAVRAIYETAASEIRDKGRSTADEFYECPDQDSAEQLLEKAYGEVNVISDKCQKDVIAKIEELTSDCQAQLDDFYNSDFSSSLKVRLAKRKGNENIVLNQILKKDWLAQGSTKIISSTTGTNAAANGLKAFSGSTAHEWVLNIGHYFGHSFKPWEAVKWVKKINIAGKALGVFGVVFSWGMQAKEDFDEDKRNKEIRENREKIRAGFNDAANSLVMHYNTAMNDFLNENYRRQIDEIDSNVQEIRSLRKNKSEAYNLLEKTQDECRNLISEIHKESISQEG